MTNRVTQIRLILMTAPSGAVWSGFTLFAQLKPICHYASMVVQFINVIAPTNDLLMDELDLFRPQMVAIRHDLVTSTY